MDLTSYLTLRLSRTGPKLFEIQIILGDDSQCTRGKAVQLQIKYLSR